MAHFHDALGAFAHHGKRLGQQGIERFTCRHAFAEALGFGPQFVVAQAFKAGFQRIDAFNSFAVLLEQPVVATAENFGEEWDGHVYEIHLQPESRETDRLSCQVKSSMNAGWVNLPHHWPVAPSANSTD